jgi:hypothetical protein
MAISTAELLLTPIDPLPALRHFVAEVDELAALDPKLARARDRISDAFAAVDSDKDGQEILGAVFWLHLRDRLTGNPVETVEALRLWLGDGDLVLRTAEDALRTTLTPQVLQSVIDAARPFGTGEPGDSDSLRMHRLSQAREELRRLRAQGAEDNPLLILGGLALGAVGGYFLTKAILHA